MDLKRQRIYAVPEAFVDLALLVAAYVMSREHEIVQTIGHDMTGVSQSLLTAHCGLQGRWRSAALEVVDVDFDASVDSNAGNLYQDLPEMIVAGPLANASV